MAYHSPSLDNALAFAAGADAALRAELLAAFVGAARDHADLLARARCDANWLLAAERLQALAASFHTEELMQLAGNARNGAPGDPRIVRRIEEFLDTLCEDQGR